MNNLFSVLTIIAFMGIGFICVPSQKPAQSQTKPTVSIWCLNHVQYYYLTQSGTYDMALAPALTTKGQVKTCE